MWKFIFSLSNNQDFIPAHNGERNLKYWKLRIKGLEKQNWLQVYIQYSVRIWFHYVISSVSSISWVYLFLYHAKYIFKKIACMFWDSWMAYWMFNTFLNGSIWYASLSTKNNRVYLRFICYFERYFGLQTETILTFCLGKYSIVCVTSLCVWVLSMHYFKFCQNK